MKLSKNQSLAANHLTGPMLVIAGPGSGKTTVIAKRANILVSKYKINPGNILVITFTRAAAQNMKARYLKISGENDTKIVFCTLHSLFFRLLHQFANLQAENIITEAAQYECIEKIAQSLKIEIDDKNEFIRQTVLNISGLKTGAIGESLIKNASYSSELLTIYEQYKKILKENRCLDFDDLMLYCLRLLISNERVLQYCRDRFKYILVDEFQDICEAQYKIIRLIAYPNNNVFAVGDDDQSIYSFRGANPSIMLNFHKFFKDTRTVTLDTNYRSGSPIINLSNKLIKNNKSRFSKKIISGNDIKSQTIMVEVDNLRASNSYIIKKIKEAVQCRLKYSDFAILSRTNKEHESIIGDLIKNNIPFISKEKMSNIFNSMVAMDILSYFKCASTYSSSGLMNRTDFIRIMNKPSRYIERAWLNDEKVNIEKLKNKSISKSWAIGKIYALNDDMKALSKLNPSDSIGYILDNIGYDAYLNKYADINQLSYEELYEQALELKEIFIGLKSFAEVFDFVDEYKDKLNSLNDKSIDDDAVTLSTFHSAKGLEYRNVFIINCVNGTIPYVKNKKVGTDKKLNLDQKTLEEERRLFYVGITRAIESLYLMVPHSFHSRAKDKSMFLKELS